MCVRRLVLANPLLLKKRRSSIWTLMKSTSTGSFPKSGSYTQPRAAIRSVVQRLFSRRRILSKTAVAVTPMKTGQQVSETKMANPDEHWRDVTSPDDSLPSPRQPHPQPHATFAPMHIADISRKAGKRFHIIPGSKTTSRTLEVVPTGARAGPGAKKCRRVPVRATGPVLLLVFLTAHTDFIPVLGSKTHFRSL